MTVIWTATDPDLRNRWVVGWYENARVYREHVKFKPPSKQHRQDGVDNYRIVAKTTDATLLPIDQRGLRLGRGPGWMGMASLWYPQDKAKEHKDIALFLNDLDYFMKSGVGADINLAYANALNDKNIKKADIRDVLIQARIGQWQFRKELLREQEESCSVTGCKVRVLLKASHIKPWKLSNNDERIDRHNGLLLIAGIDAAFDRGLVGFLDNGQMIISSQLSSEDMSSLGIPAEPSLKRNPTKRRQEFLKYHRDYIFKS